MSLEGNAWAGSEWQSSGDESDAGEQVFEQLPSTPPARLSPELDDIHAWDEVLEKRDTPQESAGATKRESAADNVSVAVGAASVALAGAVTDSVKSPEDPQVDELASVVAKNLSVGSPEVSNSIDSPIATTSALNTPTLAVSDDAHWGDEEEGNDTTTTAIDEKEDLGASLEARDIKELEKPAEIAVKLPEMTDDHVWEAGPEDGAADTKEALDEPTPAGESTVSKADAVSPDDSELADEGWGEEAGEDDWGEFDEAGADGFAAPVAAAAPIPTAAPLSKRATTTLEFPKSLEDIMLELRGKEEEKAADVAGDGNDTSMLSYRPKSRKLYYELLRPCRQFVLKPGENPEDAMVRWKGSNFQKQIKVEIKAMQENDSKHLKTAFKFGWSRGGKNDKGRPLSMPPPKRTASLTRPTGSNTAATPTPPSPGPHGPGLGRSSSLRSTAEDRGRPRKPLVQTALAGAANRHQSNSPSLSMSPMSSPDLEHHRGALGMVFGRSGSSNHSRTPSLTSPLSPMDSPMDSPLGSPLGSPILTNLAPTIAPTLSRDSSIGSRASTPGVPQSSQFSDDFSIFDKPAKSAPVKQPQSSEFDIFNMSSAKTPASKPVEAKQNAHSAFDLFMSGASSSSKPPAAQPTAQPPKPQTSSAADDSFADFVSATPVASAKNSPIGSPAAPSSPKISHVSSPLAQPKPEPARPDTSGSSDFGEFSSFQTQTQAHTHAAQPASTMDLDIFNTPNAPVQKTAPQTDLSGFDIFDKPKSQIKSKPQTHTHTQSSSLSGFDIFDKPAKSPAKTMPAAPAITFSATHDDDDDWGDFTDSATSRPRKNSYNSASSPINQSHLPSASVAQSISQSSTLSLFDTTFLDNAPSPAPRAKSPARADAARVAPLQLKKKQVQIELDMGPLQPGSKYKQQSEEKLVNDIVSSLPNLDFMQG